MRSSTVADYNAKNRAVEFCVDIYFNGPNQAPMHCTRENHLVDCSVLDEACAESGTFIGTPSANEVSFQLLGSRGTFNTTDSSSPLYNKIRPGVMVKVYCRPLPRKISNDTTHEELSTYTHGSLASFTHNEIMHFGTYDYVEWDLLGVFYVVEWLSDLTGITADVTACDTLYKLFNSETTVLNVTPNYSYEDLALDFFAANNYTPIISGDLSELLSFAYIAGDNSSFISDFAIGALAYIYCNHNGEIVVYDIDTHVGNSYTITDNDQVISITSKQSAVLDHSGVTLTYNKMQVSSDILLLSNKDQNVGSNATVSMPIQNMKQGPVYAISYAMVDSSANCFITNVKADPYSISYDVYNTSDTNALVDVNIYGNVIEAIKTVISDNTSNELSLTSTYIQNAEYAEHIVDLLHKYISLSIPILELEVRGNPLFNIGDIIHVVSDMYSVDFTGILIRQNFRYDGGLSATMSLLSTQIVGT